MKRLTDFVGGRNLVNDDLEAIQQNIDNLGKVLGNVGPFVISGVNFTLVSGTTYNVSAGLVMLNGRVVEFPATQMNLSSSKAITQKVTAVDAREYTLLGVTKNGNISYETEVVAGTIPDPVSGNEYILIIKPTGFPPQLRRLRHALQEMQMVPGMIQPVNADIAAKFSTPGVLNAQGRDEWLGWELRTAAPGVTFPGDDLRNLALRGAGGSFAVGDTSDVNVTSGATVQLTLYALHYVEFLGTRDNWTTTK